MKMKEKARWRPGEVRQAKRFMKGIETCLVMRYHVRPCEARRAIRHSSVPMRIKKYGGETAFMPSEEARSIVKVLRKQGRLGRKKA